jgi:formylglycine-generating enzyme required for sulfatase activity
MVAAPSEVQQVIAAASPAARWRYPGVHQFEDTVQDNARFFGRRQEIDSFVQQLRGSRLIVLYGKSGLGKTSLLNAGVFPVLRRHNLLPLRVRVNDPERPLLETIFAQIQRVCQDQEIDYTEGVTEGLWEFFKTAVFWRDRRLQTPVLVLDQFEEIFNLQDHERRTGFAAQLGELLSGGLPPSIRERLDRGEQLDYSDKPPALKLVISLRWEYVGRLEELFPQIPSILSHRFLLQPLKREQARLAIVEPSRLEGEGFITRPFEYAPATLDHLLDFLASGEDTVEPYQLQLFCRHAERQVAERQAKDPSITVDDGYFGGMEKMEEILGRFYLETIEKLPDRKRRRAARNLCEWGLLTEDGHRMSLAERHIVASYALRHEDLNQLIDARLVRKEPALGGYSYELAHDSLAEPIRKRRRFKLPKNALYVVGGIFLTALILIVILFVYGQYARIRAQEAELVDARRTTVAKDLFDQKIKENEQLRRNLQEATDQIEKLIGSNQQVVASLEATRTGSEIVKQATETAAASAVTRDRLQQSVTETGIRVPEMIRIDAGEFWMGSDPKLDPDTSQDEMPRRLVRIAIPFAIGKYEVTFDEYDVFALATGRKLPDDMGWGRGRRPVINASWEDARDYAKWLSERGLGYFRLPTEAEWEYVARAGTETRYWWGNDLESNRANCNGCGSQWVGQKTAPVGSFEANAFGLHDTTGNVWEWVQDCWHEDYDGAPANGTVRENSKCALRVIRGGSWDNSPLGIRPATRGRKFPFERNDFIGFRLAQDL